MKENYTIYENDEVEIELGKVYENRKGERILITHYISISHNGLFQDYDYLGVYLSGIEYELNAYTFLGIHCIEERSLDDLIKLSDDQQPYCTEVN